jgi:hypothetical protein
MPTDSQKERQRKITGERECERTNERGGEIGRSTDREVER